jgi:hypothetical protein
MRDSDKHCILLLALFCYLGDGQLEEDNCGKTQRLIPDDFSARPFKT